eukprot:CAMPEP_0180441574 /NCGR_PEP_ID=MMETSP1036_2-20121128/13697_1 /TAXON_ID=632150 /ORGANISM="Azadinium spinosum, Strain 3D9" /LENGTH=134 /DNA_ID=CAMNT_0022447795 /DNA_START=24 /DNA_END=425 /DNA_ORIENTATION=-
MAAAASMHSKQEAVLRAVNRLTGLALSAQRLSSRDLSDLDAVITRMEVPPSPAATLADVLTLGTMWRMLDDFRFPNAHRSREQHPLATANREMKVLADSRLTLFSEEEIAHDVQRRWEKFEKDTAKASTEWRRK